MTGWSSFRNWVNNKLSGTQYSLLNFSLLTFDVIDVKDPNDKTLFSVGRR